MIIAILIGIAIVGFILFMAITFEFYPPDTPVNMIGKESYGGKHSRLYYFLYPSERILNK